MNEKELAERFSRDLEGALGGAPAAAGADGGALETARKLARADFSGQSAIQASLRAELLARAQRPAPASRLAELFRRTAWAPAVFAAACLAIVMLQLTDRAPEKPARLAPAVSRARVPSRPAPSAAAAKPAEGRGAGPARAYPASGKTPPGGIFASVPLPARTVRLKEFPIQTGGAAPVARLEGRKVPVPGGTGIVWETDGAVFTLETRRIEPGELFERRTL